MKVRSFVAIAILILNQSDARENVNLQNTVKSWAAKLSAELSELGKYVTRKKQLEESFKQAEISSRNGNDMVQDIAKAIKNMMDNKISALKCIVDQAQNAANDSVTLEGEELIVAKKNFTYVNAKNMSNETILSYSDHFNVDVNLDVSAVHVPTNVFDGGDIVIQAINWSQKLDDIFIYNYKNDPSLSWQYFGSATGFMRQYPASNWSSRLNPVDLFDCRTRSWYIEAATSPKDMLILVDNSGSMTGMQREIAKHVVHNILDTLGNNDFVNVLTFSLKPEAVVEYFNESLVQANMANVRLLKKAMEDIKTDQIANFAKALTLAFKILENYRRKSSDTNDDTENIGAWCNQAIMLITDGVPYNYEEIFKEHNWGNITEYANITDMPVRVFTYLIGREVPDVREVKWMACANRGYYVHLSTMAEVREEVLKYIPVMARPLVLGGHDHPTIWTSVYVDVTDSKMSDWRWEQLEYEDQKMAVQTFRKNSSYFNQTDEERGLRKEMRALEQENNLKQYRLMTSVSMPVFDQRKNAARIARLLGVAGTDVPIEDIKKLMMPHLLGVNGYAFIVTNNGHVLTHPDFRPIFQGIWKPAYNRVDLVEVELEDDDSTHREFSDTLLMFRDAVIDQLTGNVTLFTKYHYDDMKRVGRMRRTYYYTGIEDSPFTVVISLPEHDPYPTNFRAHGVVEIHRANLENNVTEWFNGNSDNWRVHPDWTYCRFTSEGGHIEFETAEEQFDYFLKNASAPGWKWSPKKPSEPTEIPHYKCDRELFLSLVYDAKVTEWFQSNNSNRDEKGEEFKQLYGVKLAFVATRSGLTRWKDFFGDKDPLPESHFSKLYVRAIDEIWYKRAVEQHYVQPDSFVFSVPINRTGADNSTLVTASHAIFVDNGKNKAPVAVVGFQFLHTALQGRFYNITYSCEKKDDEDSCQNTCANDIYSCYLVDNNGYIVASKKAEDAGRFLGEISDRIMKELEADQIYEKISIYDYQAVCTRIAANSNRGNILLTPWKSIQRVVVWLMSQIAWAWVKAGLWDADYAYVYADQSEQPNSGDDGNVIRAKLNRTHPEPCDMKIDLYTLKNRSSEGYDLDFHPNCDAGSRRYIVQPVNFTNMLLLLVKNCFVSDFGKSIEPQEVIYNDTDYYNRTNSLRRRRPRSCIRTHANESEIKDLCGNASKLRPGVTLLLLLVCFLSRIHQQ